MATGNDRGVGRRLESLFNLGAVRELSDGQLLERFATGSGEGAELAFAALVERHGPLVLRVARGILDDPHDAEDAFQATFLVLVAKARGLWVRESLGPWLHQVAHRTASCLRASAARRQRLDRQAVRGAVEVVARPAERDDRARILLEEINRLPERFRVAVVLCDLEGRTHDQAARALGWPVGTVKSRQARARDRLRDRLTRRGIAPERALPLLRPSLSSALPLNLVNQTTNAATRFVLSRAIVPGTGAALAREVLTGMSGLQWFKAASVLLTLGAASGVGLIAQEQGTKPGDGDKPVAKAQATPGTGPALVEVKPGKLSYTVNERGFVEPTLRRDVLCEIEGGSTIIRLLPEGAQVKQGDLVAELERATLLDQLTNQVVATKQAEAAYKQALLTREVAEFAVKEYVEGVAPQDDGNLQAKIAQAQVKIEKAKARLERTKLAGARINDASARAQPATPADLLAILTVTDRLDDAELDIQGRTLDLTTAQGQLRLFREYTRDKTTKQLQIDAAKARADELSKQSPWELSKIKEAKLARQIRSCELRAPSDGTVVLASDPSRLNQRQLAIEEGTTVRERQKVFSVIDLAGPMRINTKVHESLVSQVKPGQTVRIKVDALPDQNLTGFVRSVAPMVDPTAFNSNGSKVYTTLISVDNAVPRQLRPGMSAAADILLFELDDVLTIPITAVVQIDDKDQVAVQTPTGGLEWRAVTLGKQSQQEIEVKQGLRAGDRVVVDRP